MRRETLGGDIGRHGDLAVTHRLTGERLVLADGQFDDLVNLTASTGSSDCLRCEPFFIAPSPMPGATIRISYLVHGKTSSEM